jgi:hypothetical protein
VAKWHGAQPDDVLVTVGCSEVHACEGQQTDLASYCPAMRLACRPAFTAAADLCTQYVVEMEMTVNASCPGVCPQANQLIIAALVQPGDHVVVMEPAYRQVTSQLAISTQGMLLLTIAGTAPVQPEVFMPARLPADKATFGHDAL